MDPDDARALRDLTQELDALLAILGRLADSPAPTVGDFAWPLLRLHGLAAVPIDQLFFQAAQPGNGPADGRDLAVSAGVLLTAALASLGEAVGSAARGPGGHDALQRALGACCRTVAEAAEVLHGHAALWPPAHGQIPAATVLSLADYQAAAGTGADRAASAQLRSPVPPDPTPPGEPPAGGGHDIVVPLRRR